MSNITMEQALDQIEAMIDACTLHQFLTTVATVCSLKADHIRSNWQDENLAIVWEKAAKRIEKAAEFPRANSI